MKEGKKTFNHHLLESIYLKSVFSNPASYCSTLSLPIHLPYNVIDGKAWEHLLEDSFPELNFMLFSADIHQDLSVYIQIIADKNLSLVKYGTLHR